jgi:gluconokinase
MQERQHYMKPSMLKSQFEALEEPENALVINISFPPEKIVSEILRQI